MQPLEVETGDSIDFGPCDCCGGISRKVSGFVHRGDTTEAAYFVHWTIGNVVEHGAHIDLILGRWGDGAEASNRYAVSLSYFPQVGVTVLDANDRSISAHSNVVGRGLRREEVIGTPLAQLVFDIIDAIWLQDGRIIEVVGGTP